jgi:hypothetical protein
VGRWLFIAATTTRTGLTVHAELDTDLYPTGVQVSDEAIAALPIIRHRFHGDWNYTLHPADSQSSGDTPSAGGPADASAADAPQRLPSSTLRAPELTGMTGQQLDALINALIPLLVQQRERSFLARRGGRPSQTPGTGAKAKLNPADRILATVLYLRKFATLELLGHLFGVTSRVRFCLSEQVSNGYAAMSSCSW